MKPLLYLLSGLLIGAVLTQTLDQPTTASATSTLSPEETFDEWLKPGAVMGLHHMVLREGIDRSEAERFLKEHYFPGWRDAMPGSRVFMLEGERGAKAGSFVFFWIFEDVETRDRYFPAEDGPTEEYAKYRSTLDELYGEDGFPKYATWEEGTSTDYVVIQ